MYVSIIGVPLISVIMSGLFGYKLGKRGCEVLIVGSVCFAFILTLLGVYEVGLRQNSLEVYCFSWLVCDLLDSDLGLTIDVLSLTMSCLVTCITGLVLIYSGEYMSGERSFIRYITYIGLFSVGMLILVLSNNLLLMFLGWELIGIVSYLLISYWRSSIDGNKSGIQAVMVNRVGDVSILLGVISLYVETGSVSYDGVFSCLDGSEMVILGGCLLIIGGMSKSAQVGLHTWLPNAMAAPTPISALLHAATMVTAGVFLMVRCNLLLEQSSFLLNVLVIVGSVTIIVAGSIGLVMNDIKKIIAYSTGSQLGYMMLGCGLSSYKVAMFHLLNHGAFKALLFLSAGIIIHGITDEQDVRRVGGIRGLMPIAYAGFTIGSIALLGLPFLAGYYSKDLLLEQNLVRGFGGSWVSGLGYIGGLLGVILTGIYSVRLLGLVFLVNSGGRKMSYEKISEGGWRLKGPIVFLSILSILIGYLTKEMFVGAGVDYWSMSIFVNFEESVDNEFLSLLNKQLPVLLTFLGVLVGLYLNVSDRSVLNNGKKSMLGKNIYTFLSMRFLFDKVYNELILSGVLNWGYSGTYKLVDKGLLEKFGPKGLKIGLNRVGLQQSLIQSGNLSNYLQILLLLIILCVFWLFLTSV